MFATEIQWRFLVALMVAIQIIVSLLLQQLIHQSENQVVLTSCLFLVLLFLVIVVPLFAYRPHLTDLIQMCVLLALPYGRGI